MFYIKKTILFLALITILIITLYNNKEETIIPDEAIRFRIIANSNDVLDLAMKEKVKKEINTTLNDKNNTSVEKTRENIKEKTPIIKKQIKKVFEKNNYNQTFNILYGMNYFPEKKYKGITYKQGNYESLVVEIGKAQGNNFWCVLYPPLCMIDEEKVKKLDKKEYKFFITEIIKKYM